MTSDGRFSYIWNAENRLIAVSNQTGLVAILGTLYVVLPAGFAWVTILGSFYVTHPSQLLPGYALCFGSAILLYRCLSSSLRVLKQKSVVLLSLTLVGAVMFFFAVSPESRGMCMAGWWVMTLLLPAILMYLVLMVLSFKRRRAG